MLPEIFGITGQIEFNNILKININCIFFVVVVVLLILFNCGYVLKENSVELY